MTSLSRGYDDIPDGHSRSNKTLKRSSKACDNCRKTKSKCERTDVYGELCRNCMLLGEECTFLGPRRKRGPPKGYHESIEAKLHQMEALLGAIIRSLDMRARTLIADLACDPLAKTIIQRLDDSPFGTCDQKQTATVGGPSSSNRDKLDPNGTTKPSHSGFTRPPHGWQSQLIELIQNSIHTKKPTSTASPPEAPPPFAAYSHALQQQTHSVSTQGKDIEPNCASFDSNDTSSNGLRRRRIERRDSILQSPPGWSPIRDGGLCETLPPPNFISAHPTLTSRSSPLPDHIIRQQPSVPSFHSNFRTTTGHDSEDSDTESDSSEVVDAMGQLSINEHRVFQYHGKASGLHLLMAALTTESKTPAKPTTTPAPSYSNTTPYGSQASSTLPTPLPATVINEGIWYFVAARGWPQVEGSKKNPADGMVDGLSGAPVLDAGPVGCDSNFTTNLALPHLPSPPSSQFQQMQTSMPCPSFNSNNLGSGSGSSGGLEAKASASLPDLRMQEKLLDIYFTYVHPYLPVLCKKADFMKYWKLRRENSPEGRFALSYTPNVLLLSIFAIASRYSNESPPPVEGTTWNAGDNFFERAWEIIFQSIGVSKLELVQSILLLGYREIGTGGMAAAWLLIGVAIRLAQHLGLHRSIAKWQPAGSSLFTPSEKQIRSRVWFCCVRLDKYVSTYMGRPQSIYERDYDTKLPDLDDDEEKELWDNHPSFFHGPKPPGETPQTNAYYPQASRIVSCFNASATLSSILSAIILGLYSARLPSSSVRYRECAALEEKLEKWYINLPDYLKFDVYAYSGSNPNQQSQPGTFSSRALPPPHVLTLHMQYWCTVLLLHRPFIRPNAKTEKAYVRCTTAAQHITTTAATYEAAFGMVRAPAILSYYVATASIMQVTLLVDNPNDKNATTGLSNTMKILKEASVIWPSAGRAWNLLAGTRVGIPEANIHHLRQGGDMKKRWADESRLDDTDDDICMSGYPTQDQEALQTSRLLMPEPCNQYRLLSSYSRSMVDIPFSSPAVSARGVVPQQQQQAPGYHSGRPGQNAMSPIGSESPFKIYDICSLQPCDQCHNKLAMLWLQQPLQTSAFTSPQQDSPSRSLFLQLPGPHSSLLPPPNIQNLSMGSFAELSYPFGSVPPPMAAALSVNNYGADPIEESATNRDESANAGSLYSMPTYQEPFGASDLVPQQSSSMSSQPLPQPLTHDPHLLLSTGYWNGHPVADPLGDPSLLACAPPVPGDACIGYGYGPQPPPGMDSQHRPYPLLQQPRWDHVDQQHPQLCSLDCEVYSDGCHLGHQLSEIPLEYADIGFPPSVGQAQSLLWSQWLLGRIQNQTQTQTEFRLTEPDGLI